MEESIHQVKCLRCGHAWYPRVPGRPVMCSKCKSPYWDKERKIKKIAREAGEWAVCLGVGTALWLMLISTI